MVGTATILPRYLELSHQTAEKKREGHRIPILIPLDCRGTWARNIESSSRSEMPLPSATRPVWVAANFRPKVQKPAELLLTTY